MRTLALRFDEILEAVEHLTPDAQAELVAIVHRRLAERIRAKLIKDVRQSQKEYKKGHFKSGTAADLMRELKS